MVSFTAKRVAVRACHRMVVQPYTVVVVSAAAPSSRGRAHDDADWSKGEDGGTLRLDTGLLHVGHLLMED